MTLDEEIFLAKKEKETNSRISELLEGIDFTNSSEENILMIKYSGNAEFLREYPYFDRLRECLRYGALPENIKVLWEACTYDLENLECKDVNVLKEAYTELAEIYDLLENYEYHDIRLYEASSGLKKFYRGNGSEDYLRGKAIAKLKKSNPEMAELAIKSIKNKRSDVADKILGDRRLDKAADHTDKKLEKLHNAGYTPKEEE